MPTLPTLTVTQAQADRMIAAFGSVANYKEWLKSTVIGYVVSVESQAQIDSVKSQSDQSRQDFLNAVSTT